MNKEMSYEDKLKEELELVRCDLHNAYSWLEGEQQENKQLKDNWNKLKNIAKSQSDFKLKCHNESLWFEVDELLNKMKELESSDNNAL